MRSDELNNSEKKGSDSGKSEDKKRIRLPPTLSDIVYVAIISAPSPGKNSNFEVMAVSMSDYSIILLRYSRKTRLNPGMILDLRDFGDMGHYTIKDNIPLNSVEKRVLSYMGPALISAGEKHPIGIFKAQTMAEEGIKNLLSLLNMDDPNKMEALYQDLKKSQFKGKIEHKDIFGHFIRSFSGKNNPPDIRQQEAFLKISGNDIEVVLELISGYLDYEKRLEKN